MSHEGNLLKNHLFAAVFLLHSNYVLAEPIMAIKNLEVSTVTSSLNPSFCSLENLQKQIDHMPQLSTRLCTRNKNGEVIHEVEVNRPVSDHDILVNASVHGIIATWNILNPDSPVSPGFNPEGYEGLYYLASEEDKHRHITQIAETLIQLFTNGVDGVALQEVPEQGSPYFALFRQELICKALAARIDLDFDAFHASYALTKKNNSSSYNRFATAFLMKKDAFELKQITPVLSERGSDYWLYSIKSKQDIHAINLHGDYVHSEDLAQYLYQLHKAANTLVMGDTNIPLSQRQALELIAQTRGICTVPSMNLPKTMDKHKTLDCILSTEPSIYLYIKALKNYAQSTESML